MSKKLTITQEQLANLGFTVADIQSFNIRFRIISENRNRQSAWTPIFTVENPNYVPPAP